MFCLESTEVYLKEVRCFQFPVPTLFYMGTILVFTSLKKVLQKKSCISYTIIPNLLYLLTVSGEGQGVGCK